MDFLFHMYSAKLLWVCEVISEMQKETADLVELKYIWDP